MNLSDCVLFFCVSACVKEMRVPPTVRSLYAEWVFFAFVFLFDFTQIIDNGNFGEVALMEIPQCT